jgi:hypothetical protein
MSSESDHDIQSSAALMELVMEFLENRADRSSAGGIRNDEENFFGVPGILGAKLTEELGELGRRDALALGDLEGFHGEES